MRVSSVVTVPSLVHEASRAMDINAVIKVLDDLRVGNDALETNIKSFNDDLFKDLQDIEKRRLENYERLTTQLNLQKKIVDTTLVEMLSLIHI